MTKAIGGLSVVLGIGSAIVVFLLVLTAIPVPSYSSVVPLMPPDYTYAVVGGPPFYITSMSATYHEKIYVNATQKWNLSEPVTLRICSVAAFNGAGERDPPPGPYNITIVPAVITLNPRSSVVFNATFIPWPNASDLYAYSDVTFIWEVGCQSYPVNNTSSGVLLGWGYMAAVKGAGSTPPP